MPPGLYLQKRRLAAGLTIEDLAKLLGHNVAHAGYWVGRIKAFEADVDYVAQITLIALRGVFSFKPEIYLAMVAQTPHAPVCRMCACSMFDPCQETPAKACSWTEDDLCSACASSTIVRPQLVPSEPIYELCASDPFAGPLITMLGQLHMRQWQMASLTAARLVRDVITRNRSGDLQGANQATGEDALRVASAMARWRENVLGAFPREETTHA